MTHPRFENRAHKSRPINETAHADSHNNESWSAVAADAWSPRQRTNRSKADSRHSSVGNLGKERAELFSDMREHIRSKQKRAEFRNNISETETLLHDIGIPKKDIAKVFDKVGNVLVHTNARKAEAQLDFKMLSHLESTVQKTMGSKPGVMESIDIFDQLAKRPDGMLPPEQRRKLAMQGLYLMLHADSINQGPTPLCQTIAPTERILTREPQIFARRIADAAVTGQFTARDGKTFSLDSENFDNLNLKRPPFKVNFLSGAARIFAATALTDYLGREGKTPVVKNDAVYLRNPGGDLQPYGDVGQITNWLKEMALLDPTATILEDQDFGWGKVPNITWFEGVNDLSKKLHELQNGGQMPVMITVSGAAMSGLPKGKNDHVVTVRGISGDQVQLSNSWGGDYSFTWSIHQLWSAAEMHY
jgi:hypothetical protein